MRFQSFDFKKKNLQVSFDNQDIRSKVDIDQLERDAEIMKCYLNDEQCFCDIHYSKIAKYKLKKDEKIRFCEKCAIQFALNGQQIEEIKNLDNKNIKYKQIFDELLLKFDDYRNIIKKHAFEQHSYVDAVVLELKNLIEASQKKVLIDIQIEHDKNMQLLEYLQVQSFKQLSQGNENQLKDIYTFLQKHQLNLSRINSIIDPKTINELFLVDQKQLNMVFHLNQANNDLKQQFNFEEQHGQYKTHRIDLTLLKKQLQGKIASKQSNSNDNIKIFDTQNQLEKSQSLTNINYFYKNQQIPNQIIDQDSESLIKSKNQISQQSNKILCFKFNKSNLNNTDNYLNIHFKKLFNRSCSPRQKQLSQQQLSLSKKENSYANNQYTK